MDRHAARASERDEVRPELRLEQHADRRIEVGEERANGERHVVRQPRLHDAIAVRGARSRAAGRRHVGDENRRRRMRGCDAIDQRRRRARFTERHRVQPYDRRSRRRRLVAPEPLADVLAVAGLLARAPPQPQRQQRQRDVPQQRVQRAHRSAQQRDGARISAPSAERTSSTDGTRPLPPTSRAWPPAIATPASLGSVTVNSATVGVASAAAR